MKVSLYKTEVTVIQFQARVDASYVGSIREALKELTRSNHDKFVVDLTDTSFIDSQGLGILVSLLRAARAVGGTVHLVNPSDEGVQRLFSVTKLDQVFEMFDTVEEALKSFHI